MALSFPSNGPQRNTRALLLLGCAAWIAGAGSRALPAQDLPDAPSTVLGLASPFMLAQEAGRPQLPPPRPIPPCDRVNQPTIPIGPPPGKSVLGEKNNQPCIQENPVQPIVSSKFLPPLTWQQKGELAGRDIVDPFNLFTIVAYSGIAVGSNPHSAYGPGLKGFGKLTGYGLLEDTQGEFFGTFVIPSLVREDPRYHRMPGQPFKKRLFHALSHTFVTQHDDGSLMPNYATLFTYPISAELSNLYVPGVAGSGPSTVKRIVLGLSTDPAESILAEFLPDLAKRVQIRVVFIQQIMQQIADGPISGAVVQ